MQSTMTNSKPFSEVIQSSLHQFQAQSWQWDMFPAYGSIVCIEQKPYLYFGLVYEVETGSIDSSRSPFTYQKTEEELKKEQPQIFEFLKTTFHCVVIGYSYKERIFYTAAPYPAKIHTFVRPATHEEQALFLSHERYLHRLFNLTKYIQNIDELLIALLSHAFKSNHSFNRISHFLSAYSLLTGNDYRRTKLFLQQIEPVIRMHKLLL